MRATHEHEWEAAPGLPSALPKGERVVWQGAPDWKRLAIHAFHVRKVALYFALMLAVQAINLTAPDSGVGWKPLTEVDWKPLMCGRQSLRPGLGPAHWAPWPGCRLAARCTP